MQKYEFAAVEKKWRDHWAKNPVQQNTATKPKYYCLDMFPYPSGDGLHVGHWRGYVLSDVISRYKILQGFHVLHPMGWDAFGLPAENNAIQKGIHPSISTEANVENFKRQLNEIGTVYDWDFEINTTDPNYYKWTQWIFARMFERGLAYEKEMLLNWCPTCKVVLANEEAAGGQCERCNNPVTKKNLRQWMLKITEYAEPLLNDIQTLDWPEKVKRMQTEWIGKSHGAEISFKTNAGEIVAYTTRPDTLFGATFMVLAPEHALVQQITTPAQTQAVEDYIKEASHRSSVDRMAAKEKTGVFTGAYAKNPLSGQDMPIWIADYVLADYGTGAIMCVPGHDERDFEFATKFDLPIVQVIAQDGAAVETLATAYTGDGTLVNSAEYNGLTVPEAKKAIAQKLTTLGVGKETVNYKLRDWVFSRQRYWGEPIPVIHCPACGPVLVPDDQLPVELPHVESYKPTDTGESPLALVTDWVNTTCPTCGKPAKRETNTMPQWAGSSWYFLRYADPNNQDSLASVDKLKEWLPVDYYVGGVEHAVLHLLYARFYTKFLKDIGVVDFSEPVKKLFNIGMINKNGKKMAKSKGNGVSPDALIPTYGCDALRMYEMFIGPPEMDSEWDDNGIDGVYRFLNKLWRLIAPSLQNPVAQTESLERQRHKLIYDITSRLDNLSLNTVVSGFMEHTNQLQNIAKAAGGLDKSTIETLAILLSPFAPHMAEEIWAGLGNTHTIFAQTWPVYDESKLKSDTIEIAVQINGKLRGNVQIPADCSKDDAIAIASDSIADKLDGVEIVKTIFVPGRIVNFVVKG